MNEKFLSRGKREDTGNWVEGYYVELPEDQHGKNFCLIIGLDGQYDRIIPETAGRCAGITDKNDTLIFEGDIVTVSTKAWYIVIFKDAAFGLQPYGRDSIASIPLLGHINLEAVMRDIKVIGNIHDNSEMIGGTE